MSVTVCDKITAGISPDCTTELVAGVNDRIWIGNHSDISTLTRNVTNNEIIEDIILESGEEIYQYIGKNYSNMPTTTLVVEEFASSFEHKIEIRIFADGDVVKRQLKEMKHAKLFVITQNNYQGASDASAFTMYGTRNGLKLIELEQLKGDSASLGSYRLVFASNPKALEPYPPNDVFDTNFATTLAMIEGLE